jgi:hypothetical protein
MKIHRWWLALVSALLTPWLGPHIDRYVPIGWVLLRAGDENGSAAKGHLGCWHVFNV